MSLWPRSLLGRTALIISVALILSQLAAFQLFRLYLQGPRSEQLATLASSHLRTLSAALQVLPDIERDAFLDNIEETQGIRVIADPGNALKGSALTDLGLTRFAQQMRRQLGEETEFFAQEAGRALWVRLPAGDQDWWVSIPRGEIDRPFPWIWIIWALVSAGVALAIAYLMVRRISRPLRELATAAGTLARGDAPAPVTEIGPTEIRRLGETFNRMTRELAAVERERALLLAGISHDLRTPLARLRLGIEMVPNVDATLKSAMETDIEELDAIVGQFLEYARDAGEETAFVVDLDALIREVCAGFSAHGQDVVVTSGSLPRIRLKELAIRRMIANLIANAFRHGAAPVEICTEALADRVLVKVLDRGPGVPESERERMLRPFTRMDTARGATGGSGLGLAIVDRIAAAHSGKVSLLAREGGGLEVRVELPFEASPAHPTNT